MPGHDDCSSAVSQALLSAALGGLLCVASVGACSDMSSTGPSSGGGGGNPGDTTGSSSSGSLADPLADVPDGEGPMPNTECDGGYLANPMVTSMSIIADLTVDQFTSMCDARSGLVEVQPHCGGLNACRGFSYDNTTNILSEHTCRATNSCSGWSCVICN
jgi:hypothetical protein